MIPVTYHDMDMGMKVMVKTSLLLGMASAEGRCQDQAFVGVSGQNWLGLCHIRSLTTSLFSLRLVLMALAEFTWGSIAWLRDWIRTCILHLGARFFFAAMLAWIVLDWLFGHPSPSFSQPACTVGQKQARFSSPRPPLKH
jgi:hypothetical protein